ncbi:hypothetical protein LSUE1_G002447 [Lachnellula suecica]|uniref:Heterokaryon incompatibility domain-containing protein n=1 Tax=Lachnellula suecica TaxID=602035 RepID=A0A8T9CPB1_9HELO|nr:hypothetical protein LSUE1_G002447 [Lachnellula suecica]
MIYSTSKLPGGIEVNAAPDAPLLRRVPSHVTLDGQTRLSHPPTSAWPYAELSIYLHENSEKRNDFEHICTSFYENKIKYCSAQEEYLFECKNANCRTCLDMSFVCYPRPDANYDSPHRTINTHLNYLQKSSQSGCQTCAMVFDAISKTLKASRPLVDFPVDQSTGSVAITLGQEDRPTIYVFCDSDLLIVFELYALGENLLSLPNLGPDFAPPFKPTLEYSTSFIQKQLSSCRAHDSCTTTLTKFLPKRVLDLGTESFFRTIKLVETSGQTGAEYVTLSHCWGPPDTVPKTTKATFASHAKGIALQDLPPTFQQSALVTRQLGFRYLWIDSLCIIQGDKVDWEIESSKMADVYSNCALMIAATGSWNCMGGLFFDRWTTNEGATLTTPMKQIRVQAPEGQESSVIFARPVPVAAHSFLDLLPEVSYHQVPLSSRAWAFQERVLAPRIVHFHDEELVWECKSTIRCECGNLEEPLASESDLGSLKGFLNGMIGSGKQEFSKLEMDRFWTYTLEHFSKLRLTNENDRLPALAGIASRLSPAFQSDYLAGHWRSNLLPSLCWYQIPCLQEDGRKPNTHTSRSLNGTIPSWSWASIQSVDTSLNFCVDEIHVWWTPNNRLRILDAGCAVSKNSIFGNPEGGFIRLEVPIMPAQLLRLPSNGRRFVVQGSRNNFMLALDCTAEYMIEAEVTNVHCICLFRFHSE